MYPVKPLPFVAWLAVQDGPTPPNGWEYFTGYGVVGFLALIGGWFAWKVYSRTEAERVALATSNVALLERLLTQSETHKNELLKIHEAVTPALAAAIDTLKQAARLIEESRRDQERGR